MIRTAQLAAAMLASGITGVAAQQSATPPGPPWLDRAQIKTQAQMKTADGRGAGTVFLGQFQGGVVIRGELENLPPGWHAIHVHETGKCEPSFEAAGDHLNPGGAPHGMASAERHAGDLPNIWAAGDGTARFEFFAPQFSLGGTQVSAGSAPQGAGTGQSSSGAAPSGGTAGELLQTGYLITAPSVFDDDGAAIVVHAQPDDYVTQPSGGSGDRIACGVIVDPSR